MFFPTAFFVVVSFLASSAFSATISSSEKTTVLVVDTAIDWKKGQIFYADGSLAVETQLGRTDLKLYERGKLVSTLLRLPPKCPSTSDVSDSSKVNFTLSENQGFGPYAWILRRPDVKATAFVFIPVVPGSAAENTVAGVVSLVTDIHQTTHNAEIKVGSPTGWFPPKTIPWSSKIWQITIFNDANQNVIPPQIIEMVELLYILVERFRTCWIGFGV
ncbi:hypothetical protein CROQUDRAFT_722469 [Cronartium quercuum f. sp. fusiforme G11]|uniref:Uncharacterized protein n=1 Tax=Cronartium quercuum f. sp. fusiforme G11 TaxID=708437 RepID=A0A9P6NP16_9BASI|nr:hypothetical protein CROQUDRAFT_722469 [Cronartium quercuum f. sp. fusiforme G11]